MKIEAADIDISKLLKMGIIVIPRFQRPYSWKTENIRDFWNDITSSDEGSYFIGSMVIYSMKQDFFGVVDGQQRLTTITILLCAIRDHLKNLGEHELAQGVHNYIETRDRDNVKSFILKTETSFPYLQDRIQSFDDAELNTQPREEELRLQQAYDNLNKYIDKYLQQSTSGLLDHEEKKAAKISALKGLREIIFNLKVIKIELDDEDDAYIIFETLNTRGQDLTLSDLIKNSIGSLVEKNGDIDVLKILWQKIVENISNCGDAVKIDNFFVHSWVSRFSAVTKQKAFKAFKSKLRDGIIAAGESSGRSIALSHLKAFEKDSERYFRIYRPDTLFKKYQYVLVDSLRAMRIFNVEQQIPYVLSLLRSFDEGKIAYKTLRKAMRSVENFHFQFNAITSQRSSGSIASMYGRAARNLYEAESSDAAGIVIESVKNELRERIPSKEEFALHFRKIQYNKIIRSNSLVKYILLKLSYIENILFDVNVDRLTIEHVHSQSNVSEKWPDNIINSLGNLILLSEERNKILSNKSFSQKKNIFNNWGNAVPSFVVEKSDWTPEDVTSRVNEMANIAYNRVWKI